MTQENDKKDLIITALRERIGSLVSNYEIEIALIRSEYTTLKADYDAALLVVDELKALNDPKRIYREAENV